MPYGVDKKLGGDSKKNDAWMERCVSGVMSNNAKLKKSNAIAICKSQMQKNKSKKSEIDLDDMSVIVDPETIANFNSYREQYIRKIMNSQNKTFNDAENLFEAILAGNDYIFLHN